MNNIISHLRTENWRNKAKQMKLTVRRKLQNVSNNYLCRWSQRKKEKVSKSAKERERERDREEDTKRERQRERERDSLTQDTDNTTNIQLEK